jgi:hypothetical protein
MINRLGQIGVRNPQLDDIRTGRKKIQILQETFFDNNTSDIDIDRILERLRIYFFCVKAM